jgi:large subunit ribosomal protein L23
MGRIHKPRELHHYRRVPMDPKPFPETAENNYYGKSRLFNVIPSKVGVVNKKAEDFGWPHRRPPPTGLRESPEFFPYFFSRYFPDVDCKLVIDSVLNNDTTQPMFLVPQDMSKEEIANYLKNVYGMDNIVSISTKNYSHRKYKNEVGTIKTIAGIKSAIVLLDAPVKVDFKAIKGTEDTPDNKPQVSS